MVFIVTISENEFKITSIQVQKVEELILKHKRDTPNFYDEGESEIFHVPVEDGEIRVFHHKPKKILTKRPILFIPGFGTTPWTWRQFHHTHHGYAEYYHLETRDKKSNRIRRHRKVNFTVDQIAKDIAEVIKFTGLDKRDYVLMAACMTGGAILQGLIKGYFKPPTAIVFDPFVEWKQNRALVRIVMPVLPPAVLGAIKFLIGKVVMANMKNEAQKERNMDTIDAAVPWIWRKFSLQNINYNLTKNLREIKDQVFVFHGPKDKYHPEGTFQNIARSIPNGRFFYMNTANENREYLAGAIGTSFAYKTKEDGIPPELELYEIKLKRNAPISPKI